MYKDKFYICNKLTTQFNHVSTPSRLKSSKPKCAEDHKHGQIRMLDLFRIGQAIQSLKTTLNQQC